MPDTIDAIKKAGIKVWLLTGDKLETAINISFSCNLIDKDTKRIEIDSGEAAFLNRQLDVALQYLENARFNGNICIVISGEAIPHLDLPIESEKVFLFFYRNLF